METNLKQYQERKRMVAHVMGQILYKMQEAGLTNEEMALEFESQAKFMRESGIVTKGPKLYAFRFEADKNGFAGYNSVFATSVSEAKKKMQQELGDLYYSVNWDTFCSGVNAEILVSEMDRQTAGMFN